MSISKFLPTVSWDYSQIVCPFESKFDKFYSQVVNKNSQNHVHLRFVYASHMRFFAVYIEMQMKCCVIMNDQKISALITGQTVIKKKAKLTHKGSYCIRIWINRKEELGEYVSPTKFKQVQIPKSFKLKIPINFRILYAWVQYFNL